MVFDVPSDCRTFAGSAATDSEMTRIASRTNPPLLFCHSRSFRSGRNFSAWIGIVPKQHSSVRRVRQQRKLTQEVLAFEAEIDLTYVGGIEPGMRNPSLLVM